MPKKSVKKKSTSIHTFVKKMWTMDQMKLTCTLSQLVPKSMYNLSTKSHDNTLEHLVQACLVQKLQIGLLICHLRHQMTKIYSCIYVSFLVVKLYSKRADR